MFSNFFLREGTWNGKQGFLMLLITKEVMKFSNCSYIVERDRCPEGYGICDSGNCCPLDSICCKMAVFIMKTKLVVMTVAVDQDMFVKVTATRFQCCGIGYCCPICDVCCESGGCCDRGKTYCGDGCCPPASTCYKNSRCCDEGKICCKGDYCCLSGYLCYADECRPISTSTSTRTDIINTNGSVNTNSKVNTNGQHK